MGGWRFTRACDAVLYIFMRGDVGRIGAASAKPIKVQMYGDTGGIASSTVTGKSS